MSKTSKTPAVGARFEFIVNGETRAVVDTRDSDGSVQAAAYKFRELTAAGLSPEVLMTDLIGTLDVSYALREFGRVQVENRKTQSIRNFMESRHASFAAVAKAEADGRVLEHIKVLIDGEVDAIFEKRVARFAGSSGGWICAALDAFLAARRRYYRKDVRAVLVDEKGEIDISEFFAGPTASEFRVGWDGQVQDLRVAARRRSTRPMLPRGPKAA
jgi:hypothetical protein